MRVLAAAVVLAAAAVAQERISLNGPWEIAAEPRDETLRYRDKIEVPSAWESVLGLGFDGAAWYRRTLPLRPEHQGARIRVEFTAVAAQATVFCNGKEMGSHLGGWTPFRVDVTEPLKCDGSDVLEVRVDERVGHNTQGFLPIIEPHFGGIWQDVTLGVDRGPVIDRITTTSFGTLNWAENDGHTPVQVGDVDCLVQQVAFGGQVAPRVRVEVLDGATVVATAERETTPEGQSRVGARLRMARGWAPGAPNLYGLRITLLGADGQSIDQLERRVGFRTLAASGTELSWNNQPLQVRGVLHWGYSPPLLAPPSEPMFWRRQLEDFKSIGFNTLKCCLWVPPSCVYDLCDELGLLVWQEYPTWHPKMDAAHKDELLREYGEFFAHDSSHPSVAFRSLTCETGQGADLDVVKSLFDACHAAVADTLVVDDSSWIGWQRVTDFWDEHPYGNNAWWPGRLAEFQKHIAEKGKKPLLLGECIAADTWADRAAWVTAHGDQDLWWRPACFQDQARFEQWIVQQFGDATRSSLGPISRDYALRTRRYQIEKLRAVIPEAGYVVSVARDFQKARMGLYDDFDRMKWTPADWAWQRDLMLSLVTDHDRRAFRGTIQAPVVVTAFGNWRNELHGYGQLSLRLQAGARAFGTTTQQVTIGRSASAPVIVSGTIEDAARPQRVQLSAELRADPTASGGANPPPTTSAWDLWWLPPIDDRGFENVRVTDHLDLATMDFLEQGGRVLLRVTGQKHSLRSEGKWYLTGAPFAPPHPLHRQLPVEMLLELQPFDLDGGRVMPWQNLLDQVDPILAFWETHDIDAVKAHLFACDCNVGKGRLLASCLDHESDAGRYVEHVFLQHLAHDPTAQRRLTPATVATIRALLSEKKIDLPVWRFRTDSKDEGSKANWQDPKTDTTTADWRDLRAGAHWENQAKDLEHYDGIAWYQIAIEVPADWRDQDARAVFEGIDDSAIVWLNGEEVGRFGDPATGKTVWLERSVAELGRKLRPAERNVLTVRVVDHVGAGGLWKPVFLTTGPVDNSSTLLQ